MSPAPTSAAPPANNDCAGYGTPAQGPIVFPIAARPPQRFLVDAAGAPILIQGDAAWSIIVQLTHDEVDQYLADRKARGFNTILVNLLEHKFSSKAPDNIVGDSPFSTPGDFSTPNEAYFANADWVLQRARDEGFIVLLAPAYVGYKDTDEGWLEEMMASGPDKLREYGRYVGQRFGSLGNILWVEAGDNTFDGMDLVNAVAEGIAETDPDALQTAHTARHSVAADEWAKFPWFNVNNVYGSDDVGALADKAEQQSDQPFFMIEGVYEYEHDVTTELLRAQAYDAVLAGATGQVFGNNPIWYFDGVGLFTAPMTWQQALGSPGSQSMEVLGALFHSLEWWKLVPDTDQPIADAGSDGGPGQMRGAVACDGSVAVVYVTGGGALSIHTDRLRAGTIAFRWYDPSSGTTTSITDAPTPVEGAVTLETPGKNEGGDDDWVLVAASS